MCTNVMNLLLHDALSPRSPVWHTYSTYIHVTRVQLTVQITMSASKGESYQETVDHLR